MFRSDPTELYWETSSQQSCIHRTLLHQGHKSCPNIRGYVQVGNWGVFKPQTAPSCSSPGWGEACWGEETKRDGPMLAAGSVSGSWQGMCAEGQRKERQGRYFPSQQKYFTAHRPWDYTAPDMNLHTPDLCTHQTSAHTESPWVGTQALLVVASPRLHTQYHTSAGHGGQKGLCPLLRGRGTPETQKLVAHHTQSSQDGAQQGSPLLLPLQRWESR